MAPVSCRPGLPCPHKEAGKTQPEPSQAMVSPGRQAGSVALLSIAIKTDAGLCVGTGISISTSSHIHIEGIQLNPNKTLTSCYPAGSVTFLARPALFWLADTQVPTPLIHHSLASPDCVWLSPSLQMIITWGAFAITIFFICSSHPKMSLTHAAKSWIFLLQEMKGRVDTEGEKLRECLKGENEWIKMQDNLGRFICNRGWEGSGIPGLGLAWANL